jgi:hypothetical protein
MGSASALDYRARWLQNIEPEAAQLTKVEGLADFTIRGSSSPLGRDADRYPPIWSIADMGRELETHDPVAVIRPLCNAVLIHRTSDDFVFAAAAAFLMVQMVGHVI